MEALLALLLAAQALSPPQPDAAAVALVQNVEARERSLKGLEADFEQRYRSSALAREMVEKGKLSLKAPGKMLFEYTAPEKKTFVSDGDTSYFYVPHDRQVIVQKLKGEKGLLATLLTGRESILDRFAVSLVPSEETVRRLLLEPKKPDPDIDRVLMDVGRSTLIERLEILDTQGNRTVFRFERVRESTNLSDRLFRFEVPKDVEIVQG